MTIQQLRCFVSVSKTLNFARAAALLHVTQPAVTHQIQTLERELGVPLLDRIQKRVALTPAGRVFYEDAVEILDRLDQAAERAQNSRLSAEMLRVGFEETIQIRSLPEIFRRYHELFPHVFINNVAIRYENRQEVLTKGLVDVAFTAQTDYRRVEGLAYAPLFTGYFACVLPKEHPLAGRELIRMEDLQDSVFILLDTEHCPPEMDAVQKEIRQGCPHATFYFSASSLCTVPMIEGGLGIAVMPNFVCPESAGVRIIPFDTSHTIRYGITWHENEQSPKILKFVQTVKACRSGGKSGAGRR